MKLLEEFSIGTLIDIRRFPTSRIEYFKKEKLERWLPNYGVEYVWLGWELGGYRQGGYQAHIETELFRDGIEKLLEFAKQKRVCIMCMEKNPKYCHRRFVSAHLEEKGVEIRHIFPARKRR